MAGVTKRWADIVFLGGPDVRRTPEAAQWRKLKMRRRMDTMGWKPAEITLSGGDEVSEEDSELLNGVLQAMPAAEAAAAAAAALAADNASDPGGVPPAPTLPPTLLPMPPAQPTTSPPLVSSPVPSRAASLAREKNADFLESLTPRSLEASPEEEVQVVGSSAPIGFTEMTVVVDLAKAPDSDAEDEIEALGAPTARPPSVGERRRASAAVRGKDTKRRRLMCGMNLDPLRHVSLSRGVGNRIHRKGNYESGCKDSPQKT